MKSSKKAPSQGGSFWLLAYSLSILLALCLAAVLLVRDGRVQHKLHQAGILKNGKLNLYKTSDILQDDQYRQEPVLEAKTEEAATPPVPGFTLPPHILLMRPRPQDYDFKAMREQVQAYMELLPPESRDTEKERIRYLGSYKEYLISKMQKIAYAPEDERGLLLANGRRLQGSITMFSNAQNLKIRLKNTRNPGLMELAWSELSQEEFFKIAHFYVQRQVDDLSGSKRVAAARLDELFDEYLYLILLADWYQKDELLKQYCQEFDDLPVAKQKDRLLAYIQWPKP
ncbi:MAG: hypothetical protein PHG44_03050 [Lentisphaeria bacterium]|jgi:hypothetical protein|nr:hypothetical protein [Lentisphaeria bacterium]